MQDIISQRRASKETRPDLLQALLDARTEDGEPLPDLNVMAHALLMMAAGSDTTSNVCCLFRFRC